MGRRSLTAHGVSTILRCITDSKIDRSRRQSAPWLHSKVSPLGRAPIANLNPRRPPSAPSTTPRDHHGPASRVQGDATLPVTPSLRYYRPTPGCAGACQNNGAACDFAAGNGALATWSDAPLTAVLDRRWHWRARAARVGAEGPFVSRRPGSAGRRRAGMLIWCVCCGTGGEDLSLARVWRWRSLGKPWLHDSREPRTAG